MRTRLTGPIQTVSKCKRDTSQSISMILQSTKINLLRLMILPITTSRSHKQSPWETFRTALTCKSPLWMTERKVDQLIFMTVPLSSLCKIEFWFVMTRKVLPKVWTRPMPTKWDWESLPSIICRSLIPRRVGLSKEKDNWSFSNPCSISSYSITANKTPSRLKTAPQLR